MKIVLIFNGYKLKKKWEENEAERSWKLKNYIEFWIIKNQERQQQQNS